jgi:hypothetical protein
MDVDQFLATPRPQAQDDPVGRLYRLIEDGVISSKFALKLFTDEAKFSDQRRLAIESLLKKEDLENDEWILHLNFAEDRTDEL